MLTSVFHPFPKNTLGTFTFFMPFSLRSRQLLGRSFCLDLQRTDPPWIMMRLICQPCQDHCWHRMIGAKQLSTMTHRPRCDHHPHPPSSLNPLHKVKNIQTTNLPSHFCARIHEHLKTISELVEGSRQPWGAQNPVQDCPACKSVLSWDRNRETNDSTWRWRSPIVLDDQARE